MNTQTETKFCTDDIKHKIDDKLDSITQYSQEKKQEFENTLEESIEQFDHEVAKLQQRAKSVSGDARQEIERLIVKLQTEREMFEAKLKSMRSQSNDAWMELKSGIKSAWQELTDAFQGVSNALESESKSD